MTDQGLTSEEARNAFEAYERHIQAAARRDLAKELLELLVPTKGQTGSLTRSTTIHAVESRLREIAGEG